MNRPERATRKPRGKPKLLRVAATTLLAGGIAIGMTIAGNLPTISDAAYQNTAKGLLLKAWSGAGIKSGKAKAYYDSKDWKEDYKFEVGTDTTVTADYDGKIDLEATCKEQYDSEKPMQKYWIWFEENKQSKHTENPFAWSTRSSGKASPSTGTYVQGASVWHTYKFIGTMRPINCDSIENGYNAKEYESEGDYFPLPRFDFPSGKDNGFIKCMGGFNNGGYAINAYAVDIEPWWDKLNEDNDLWRHDIGRIYLHPVVKVSNSNAKTSALLYTLKDWNSECTANSIATDSNWKTHYNKWIKVAPREKIKLTMYKVVSEEDWPTDEEMDFNNKDTVISKSEMKEIPAYTKIDLSGIKTTKDNGTKYYLKGIRVRFRRADEELNDTYSNDKGHFYIGDKDIIGTDKETKDYSINGNSGKQKDTLSDKKNSFEYINAYKFSYDDDKVELSSKTEKDLSDDYNTHTNPEFLSGSQSYEDLAEHIADLQIKTWSTDVQICLVYQKAEQKGVVKVKREFFDWDEEDEGYKKEKSPEPETYVVGAIKSDKNSGSFDMDKTQISKGKYNEETGEFKAFEDDKAESRTAFKFVMEEKPKKLTAKQKHCPIDVNHYIRYVKVNYYVPDQKKKQETKFKLSDFTDEDKDVWSGKDSDEASMEEAVKKLLKSVNVKGVDFNKDITISLQYYQPWTPTVLSYWVSYVDESETPRYQLLQVLDKGEDGEREKRRHINVGTGTKPGKFKDFPEELKVSQGTDGKYVIGGNSTVKLDKVVVKNLKIKDYFGAEKDLWTETSFDGGPDLPNDWKKGATEVNFNTNAKGCFVAVIYKAEQPTLTVNLYKAIVDGDPHENDNLDQPVTIEQSKEECGFGSPCLVPMDRKLINTAKGHTEEIKDFLTLKDWGYKAEDADKYRLIVGFTDADDEGNCIKKGPPVSTDTLSGNHYLTTIQWEALSSDSVVLNLYYVKIEGNVLESKYKINVFAGEAKTKEPANNPAHTCPVAKNEINFIQVAEVEGPIDNTTKEVKAEFLLPEVLQQLTGVVHIKIDGVQSDQVSGFTPAAGMDPSKYGMIPDFTVVSDEKHVDGPGKEGSYYKFDATWEAKKQEVITINVYYVKQVKKDVYFHVYIYTGSQDCSVHDETDPTKRPPAKSSVAWNLVEEKKYPISEGSATHTAASSWIIQNRTGTYMKDFTTYSGGVTAADPTYTAEQSDEYDRYLYLYYFVWIAKDKVVTPDDEYTDLTWNDIKDRFPGPGSETDPASIDENATAEITAGIQPDQIVTTMGDWNSGAQLGGEGDITIPDGMMNWQSSQYLPNKLKTAIECTSYMSAGRVRKHVSTLEFYLQGTASVSYVGEHSSENCTECHKSHSHTITVHGTDEHGRPTTSTVANPDCDHTPHSWSGIVTDRSYSDTRLFKVTLKVVWFELMDLYIWQPEEGRVYSYSFPNSTTGDKTEIDNDGDTRKWAAANFKEKDYFVKMMKKQGLNVWKDSKRTDTFRDPGEASTGNAICEFFQPWLDIHSVFGTEGESFNKHVDKNCDHERTDWPCSSCTEAKASDSSHEHPIAEKAMKEEAGKILNELFEDGLREQIGELVRNNSNIQSDQLFFYHPTWEDCDEELKVSSTKLVWHDMYGTTAKAELSREFASVLPDEDFIPQESYSELCENHTEYFDYDEKNVRIPEAKKSTDKTPYGGLFECDQIRVDQSKLNTKTNDLGVLEDPSSKSKAWIKYDTILTVGGGYSNEAYMYTEELNKVNLYTPIAITTEISQYKPDAIQTAKVLSNVEKTITLGTPFVIKLDYNGNFNPYGDVDTSPYTDEYDKADFLFDYPVFVDSGGVSYHEAGELFTVHNVSQAIFYPAYWTEEGRKLIQTEVNAFNIYGQDAMESIKPRYDRENRMGFQTNSDRQQYRAYCLLNHWASGILTDLRITDVADYPELQPIFRIGDTYKKTGFAIHAGQTNFQGFRNLDPIINDGSTITQTFPVVDGNALSYKKYDTFKTGYTIRFNLTTIASLFNKTDSIEIEPTFTWVAKSPVLGATPVPVTVLYDENINGTTQKLVEVGSALDKMNIHQLCIGDKEHDVLVRDLVDTAQKNKYNQPKELIQKLEDSWTYGDITIPSNMKVSEGLKNKDLLSYSYDGKKLGLGTVDDTTLNNCLQNWYGEYYLPNTIHVMKNDAASVAKFKEDAVTGYDFSEDYWCNSGYLIVNFNIYTVKDEEKHLLYNAKGVDSSYCDMWNTENRVANKVDSWFQPFKFQEGDFVMYKLGADGSMSSDYKSGGTH